MQLCGAMRFAYCALHDWFPKIFLDLSRVNFDARLRGPDNRAMTHFSARMALMLGNFVIGTAIVGIAGMLPNLASGLGVTIQQAGLLITAGAVVLCIGSPLTVWGTSAFDRRRLLGVSLVLVALGHFASAF